jgi:uncharacterized flavoprotein (TIGR03862 family)
MADASCDVLVIGGGPAGLRAAEIVSAAGWRTIVTDRMPSVGRKFLVAGRGGLNLTHSEPMEKFVTRYGDSAHWRRLLADFSPEDLRAWALGLEIETFVGTSGRVFPTTKQAAPLLRRWIARLKKQGVEFRMRHEWRGLSAIADQNASFETPHGTVVIAARAIVLALGGGSWPQTGSNGGWISILQAAGVETSALAPANCGYEVSWPAAFLTEAEGLPLKNIVVRTSGGSAAGELLITRYGLEGGALYQLGRLLRADARPAITIDLKPGATEEQLAAKLGSDPRDLLATANRVWRLSPSATALLRLKPVKSGRELAALAKNFWIRLKGPRPLAEAISSAGGVAWKELTDHLMLRKLPGWFCAGEMIDWEAPTGGYLIQGCFSTATRAARGVDTFFRDVPRTKLH